MAALLLHMRLSEARVWTKHFDTPFLPVVGRRVVLYPNRDDPLDGPEAVVLDVRWAANGSVHVELKPPPDLQDRPLRKLADAGWSFD